jgi:hypothetical protein
VLISIMTRKLYLEYKELDDIGKQTFINNLDPFYNVSETGVRPFIKLLDTHEYSIGDLVECINKDCLKKVNELGINKNFFIIKKINIIEKKMLISRMTPELYLEYKELDGIEKQTFINNLDPFYYVSETDVRPCDHPTPIIKLLDYQGIFSDNLYMFTGHGWEDLSYSKILLKENQKVILLCQSLCKFYITTKHDWELVMNSKTSNDFIEKLKKNQSISNQLCVFEGSVPNISLRQKSSSLDSPYYRWGLYKIPLLYDFDNIEKHNFLRENFRSLNNKIKLSKRIDIHDLSRVRPYVKITSPHMYNDITNYYLLLEDIINYLGDAEFTLVLFVCRS